MKFKPHNRRLFSIILFLCLIINGLVIVQSLINDEDFNTRNSDNKRTDNLLHINQISNDNILSGVGRPWNITHWANRTDKNIDTSFSNGTYDDSPSIPIGDGWIGYEMDAKIYNLRDRRNWSNGTFNFGPDDGNNSVKDNDNELTANNKFQNWTFNKYDNQNNYTNPMSGNYYSNIDGHSCLELKMNGDWNAPGSNTYGYDNGDKAWWSSSISIPRGNFIDGELQFEVKTDDSLNINSWRLKFHINNKIIYSIGLYDLERFCENNWVQINVPLKDWDTDPSQIFLNELNKSQIYLNVSLEYTVGTTWYRGFSNNDNQTLYVDNIDLFLKSEVKPSQIGLIVDNKAVSDKNSWGSGEVSLENINFNGSEINNVNVNFSSTDTWTLSKYEVDLEVDLNLFVTKSSPNSNYELNTESLGTLFIAENGTKIQWESYGYVAIPTGYVETKMRIEFPTDINITHVFGPKDPSTNVLSSCDSSHAGIIDIPVNSIESSPSGYWKFQAISPNYFQGLNIYNNNSGAWIYNNDFFSGEYVNITSQIFKSSIISGHLNKTNAILKIRFPDGSLWQEETQMTSVDKDGLVQFDIFQIPVEPPNYEVGMYKIIVYWNNSYNNFQLNETGIILGEFEVSHDSILSPEREIFDDITEGDLINLRVSFSDKKNKDSIQNALVYTYNFTDSNQIKIFDEINPGIYLLEFNTIGGNPGSNEITIWANSTTYKNTNTTITLNIIKQTEISVNSSYLANIPYKQNFTVQFNYTETYFGDGIETSNLTTDWTSDYSFQSEPEKGVYTLTCNASGIDYEPGKLYTLIINVGATNYISKTAVIRIYISELTASLKLLIDGAEMSPDQLNSFEIWETINVTAEYKENSGNHLSDSTVKANIGGNTYIMEENSTNEFYQLLLNASDLGLGIDYLSISANKTFYNPQSFRMVIQITERLTSLEILFNGINKTGDPTIDLPIGSILNLTVKYKDTFNSHVSNASLALFGDYTANFTENDTLEQYSLIINTSKLEIGVKIITLSASLENYESQVANLRLNIRRITTIITTINNKDSFEVKPGQTIKIRIIINNSDFGEYVKSATISYRWEYGAGTVEDTNNDGVYEIELTNVAEGSHKLYINAFAGDNYQINEFDVTISAVLSLEDFALFIGLIVIALIIGIGLATYLIIYRTILRYPKPVRKLRKFRHSLKRDKKPSIEIIDRKNAFDKEFLERQTLKTKPFKPKSKIQK